MDSLNEIVMDLFAYSFAVTFAALMVFVAIKDQKRTRTTLLIVMAGTISLGVGFVFGQRYSTEPEAQLVPPSISSNYVRQACLSEYWGILDSSNQDARVVVDLQSVIAAGDSPWDMACAVSSHHVEFAEDGSIKSDKGTRIHYFRIGQSVSPLTKNEFERRLAKEGV